MQYFISHPVVLGGFGVLVELDEAVLGRRKNNMGRILREQWVFAGREGQGLK
jgi:hypothetical protein